MNPAMPRTFLQVLAVAIACVSACACVLMADAGTITTHEGQVIIAGAKDVCLKASEAGDELCISTQLKQVCVCPTSCRHIKAAHDGSF